LIDLLIGGVGEDYEDDDDDDVDDNNDDR